MRQGCKQPGCCGALTLIEDLQRALQLYWCRGDDGAIPLILFLLLLGYGLFRVQRPLVRQLLHRKQRLFKQGCLRCMMTPT